MWAPDDRADRCEVPDQVDTDKRASTAWKLSSQEHPPEQHGTNLASNTAPILIPTIIYL